MQNRKFRKLVPPTRHSTPNSNISFFTNEELERALPRLSFFDCHAKATRLFPSEPEKLSDSKTGTSDISIKNLNERRLKRSSSHDIINADNKNPVLDSCKISEQNQSSTRINPISNYVEVDSVSDTPIHSKPQSDDTKNFQNAGNSKTKVKNEMLLNIHELSDSIENVESNDSVLKAEKGDTTKMSEKKSKSEGFQYLMEYLLCLKNTSNNNTKEINFSPPQMKPNDPKYMLDSLKRSASIFAPQHRVLHSQTNSNNNNLFTAIQQLHSRLIVSTNRPTNLNPSSCEQSCSDLDECRHRLGEWMETVTTNEFMKTLDEVLSTLGDNICHPWSGLPQCRYLRLPPSQRINQASRQKRIHFKTD